MLSYLKRNIISKGLLLVPFGNLMKVIIVNVFIIPIEVFI